MGLLHSIHRAQYLNRFLPTRNRRLQRDTLLRKAVIDSLELRTMLSTYTVNTSVDNGSTGSGLAGPLRWVIQQADNATGSQTITFASSVTTIDLNGTALDIDKSNGQLTIDGPGAGALTINAMGNSNAITVSSTSEVEIEGITIEGGYQSGYTDGSAASRLTCSI
jgi:hypothetical protein